MRRVKYTAILFMTVSAACFFHRLVVLSFGAACVGYLVGYYGGILLGFFEPDPDEPEDPEEADVEEVEGIRRAA